MKFEVKNIKIKDIVNNKGQIEGLPANPRVIKNNQFDKLVKSIKDNPEMLSLRELLVTPDPNKPERYIILGGNMRCKAMRCLDYTEAPCKIITDATVEQMKAYIIKDNADFGEWDLQSLQEWDLGQLAEWGLDVPEFKEETETETEEAPQEAEEEKEETSEMDDFYLAVYKNYIYAYRDTYVVSPNSINDPEYRCIQNAQDNKKNALKSNKNASDFTL